jgi:voltage-gated potassium channel
MEDEDEALEAPHETLAARQILILILSVYILIALFVQAIVHLTPTTQEILNVVDTVICFIFIVDFFINLYYAKPRSSYLKWGWIDLISSIPMLGAFRWGRAVRAIRILRLLRGIRSTKVIIQYLLENRAESAFTAATLVSITLAFWASITILHLETVPEANIKSAEDALWWAATTMTTVGYGDKYPVTTEGRVLGFILMVCGVGLFGTFTGYVASWFLQGRRKMTQTLSTGEEIQQLREEIKRLSRLVEHTQDNRSAKELQRPQSDSPSGAAGEP